MVTWPPFGTVSIALGHGTASKAARPSAYRMVRSSLPCTKKTEAGGPENGIGRTWRLSQDDGGVETVVAVVAGAGEHADRGDAAGGVPGRRDVRLVEAAPQRVAGPGVEGEHLGEHVRGVGGLVDHVDHVKFGDSRGGVRVGRAGDDEARA
nr:hypothetical protein GCM10020092_013970 [Actinoplanes digitatis]